MERNIITIALPPGEGAVQVEFAHNGIVLGEVIFSDEFDRTDNVRTVTLEASPVDWDANGERHGIEDNPRGEQWTLLTTPAA